MSRTQGPTLDEVKRIIHSTFVEARQSENMPILLSNLGAKINIRLNNDFGQTFKQMYPDSTLSSFIREYLDEVIELIVDENNPLRVSAQVRSPSKEEHHIPDEIAVVTRQYQAFSFWSPPQFDSGFWSAFAKPMKEGKRRYLTKSPPYRFDDEPDDFPPPPNTYEIPKLLIMPNDLPREFPQRRVIVLQSIMKWLKEQNLSYTIFIDSEKSINTSVPQEKNERKIALDHDVDFTTKKIDAILSFIECLSENDRNQISIPLDILYRVFR